MSEHDILGIIGFIAMIAWVVIFVKAVKERCKEYGVKPWWRWDNELGKWF